MRRTAPYLLTPIGRPPECQPMYVLGPELGMSYSQLLADNERLREQVNNESRLRLQAQDRLSKAMRVFAVLGFTHPNLRDLIRRAREDIFSG